MNNTICCLCSEELEILNREGFNYTVINVSQVDYFDMYDIQINGDKLYVDMALDAIRKADCRY